MSDNTDLSDADKIRLKRLARLGTSTTTQQGGSAASEEQASPSQSSSTTHTPASAGSRLLATPPANPANPSSAPSSSSRPTNSAAAKIPVAESAVKPSPLALGKRPASTTPIAEPVGPRVVSSRGTANLVKVDFAQWQTEKVEDVFSVTLSKRKAQESDWALCWLKGLTEELREEGHPQPLETGIDLADRLLIARLSLDTATMASSDDPDALSVLAGLPTGETIFEYLTGCWKRLYRANRESHKYSFSTQEKASWAAAFDKLKALIISYCGMTLEDPSMFPQPQDKSVGPAEFLPLLLSVTAGADSNGDQYTTSVQRPAQMSSGALTGADLLPFLNDLAIGFPSETMTDVITPTLSLFFQEWYKISPTPDILGSDWRRYLGAVALLVQVKSIAAILPTLPIWLAPDVNASKLEWQSLLGPLTRLSVFPREFPDIWKTYFSNPTERKKEDIDANKSNLRYTLGGLHTSLFNIYNGIVRASPDSREGILDFFALTIKLNEKRAGMRVDPRTVSSDGYMTNLSVVLLKLFEPVMDAQFSKIDKVDPAYYKCSKRIDITEETKIRGTKEEADEYFTSAMQVDAKPNFISDLFFLMNAFIHLGIVKTIGTRERAEKNMSEIEKELKRAEAQRPSWAGNAAMETQGEAAVKKLKSDIATLHASIHAYDTQLLDPALVRLTVSFMGFLMTWLIRLVDPSHRHPSIQIKLPLPAEASLEFRMLPEYLFDNVTEYFDFLARYHPDALDDVDKDILITFVVVFLSPNYVNNPFLKAKLVSILSYGLWPTGYWRKGALFDRLSIHGLSTEYLMPTLIRFFIDVESTGGHTQFWGDRRNIQRIFKSMWENPLHREAFVKARHDDFDQFVRFVNMLMSDTTFHLEESLTGMAKISAIQSQKADTDAWAALPQNEREDQESQLRSAESSAPFHTQMGLENVKLIRDITATTKEPFVASEIVDRLAASLDENLAVLVGPKMSELKVANPEKYSFKPKDLLAAIAQVYLNLGNEADFIRAVANDGRSYSKELFEKFARLLKNRAIMTDAEVAEVVSFTQKVEDMRATIQMEDEREVPDEFLERNEANDASVMKDPVILPVSRVVIDRGTIRTVLLSKEVDPFNNVPLKYEECIPDTELKAKIDAWLAEGNTQKAADVMDVDQL
uniref:RING-type E3 ubiquitin transferase n=1 Tax=Kwoniella dejecticola CBS 10117 TaxID=1296121 RepID=A0A1A6A4J9_9TREE|nr:ubiquitin-conjugation factor E4 B [Kwoniella dejecticola CBS 10117]OBR84984.1 ubiquitin-conjugation factor E4 B [Kwoniella dejecticola CBS 10117]